MLGLCCDAETIVSHLYLVDFVSIILAKSSSCPVARIEMSAFWCPTVDVPSEVHAELQFLFGWLDVAYVYNPLVLNALCISLAKLVAAKRWRDGAEPEIRIGRAPIGEVIVEGIAARTGLLSLVRHLTYVTVIVVHPHQGDIFGHLQTCIVGIEHFFIRNEDLRDSCRVAYTVGEELPLVSDDVGQGCYPFGCRAVTVDASVVYASHAKCIDGVLASAFANSLSPVALYHLLVCLPVPVIVVVSAIAVPFPFVVAQHLLAMAGTHIDVVFHDEWDVGLHVPESTATVVHGGPKRIGSQAEKQLHDSGIGLGTDVFQRSIFHLVFCPRLQSEVLVVEEDAAELDRRRAEDASARRYVELHLDGWCHICPPNPRRDAHHTAQFKHAISCGSRLRTEDDECLCHAFHRIVNHLHAECFPFAFDIAHVNLSLGNELVDVTRLPDSAYDDGTLQRCGLSLVLHESLLRDCFQVGKETIDHRRHHFAIVGVVEDDGLIGRYGTGNREATINGRGYDL